MARMLVIEDDEPMRRLIRRMLEHAGHGVTEARDGAEALQRFRERPSDLAVVDIYLPEQSGWDTIRALRRISPGLPLVIVSGGAALEGLKKGSPGTLDTARRSGAFRILRKPFAQQTLMSAVDELLSPDRISVPGTIR